MDIPNFANSPNPQPVKANTEITFSLVAILVVSLLAVVSGFWISRFFPTSTSTATISPSGSNADSAPISTDKISDVKDIQVGKVYGNTEKNFKDTATGTIEKGSINGEGTHILNRPGGLSQRASLTSSVVDLDLFVGRQVEVKGETNASNKTSWLLDVGSLKVLE